MYTVKERVIIQKKMINTSVYNTNNTLNRNSNIFLFSPNIFQKRIASRQSEVNP